MKKIRKMYVGGRFYPDKVDELEKMIERTLAREKEKINVDLATKKIIGGVVPHAGYVFSAYQAIHFFELLRLSEQKFNTVVIINPSHTGYGEDISLCGFDAWDTPYGLLKVDGELALLTHLKTSPIAHEQEHSGEVMLPLLKYFLDYEFKILPITLRTQSIQKSRLLASALMQAVSQSNKNILVIASSDFSHYVSPDYWVMHDDFVINEIINMDVEQIYRQVKQRDVSCCGYGPIMAMVEYANQLCPSPKTVLLARGHSGEVMPMDEVVHYVSLATFMD